jgi:prepilin-type N-terminal cleavage/methylation domain-containing protein
MRKQRGFTLVELLVVIAIIALLMSILMPTLAKVRKQAKSVLCQSNLKQWAAVSSMYAGDNDGYFAGLGAGDWTMTGTGGWWMNPLRPYYKEPKLKLCPMATKPYLDGGQIPFGAWTVPDYFYEIWRIPKPDHGSYGFNGWIANAVEEDQEFGWFVEGWQYHWRTFNVKGGNLIPLILDCADVDGWPHHSNQPPDYDGEVEAAMINEMKRFCINRHHEEINGAFLDCSVRKIGLKELWKLKWSRTCDINADPPVEWDSPGHWMYGMKDY